MAKPKLAGLSKEQWAAFERRHAAGESLSSIARSIGVTKGYFCTQWKKRKLPTPNRAFIPGSTTGTAPVPTPPVETTAPTKPKIWEVR